MSTKAKYDIILFGVTGFTGKLAAEYLFEKNYATTSGLKWAVSARNAIRAEEVLHDKAAKVSSDNTTLEIPEIFVADLVCQNDDDIQILRDIVQQTKVVLTCSGPFEKYSPTLVQLCAEGGVYYADITGESDFFRQTIAKHDAKARETGAVILCHCGNDCIPNDLMVYEMNRIAQTEPHNSTLQSVMTYAEISETAAFSGGTATTAAYQLSKKRTKSTADAGFDPLLMTTTGEKSEFITQNICPKSDIAVPALPGRKAAPWIMGPVMMNCVRRSNALLGYSKEFAYGDALVKKQSYSGWVKDIAMTTMIGAAVAAPKLFSGCLPKAGEGPSRYDMEHGFLKLHAIGTLTTGKTQLEGIFQFNKDVSYLYTAALLCETGMLLVEKYGTLEGGCKTPASALGSDLTQRILTQMDTSLEVKEKK